MLTDDARQNLSTDAQRNISAWLTESKYAQYRDELQDLLDAKKWSALEDAFFKVIEFGTGGRRGTTGVGSNRINRVTIGESAQALCDYARSVDDDAPQKGVVIACDTRLTSPELSRYTAQVCAEAGFTTYLFEDFRSTPELSYAVRHVGASIGIVISASHNPPADNGFKAYWSDGGQLVAPHDKGVMNKVKEIKEVHLSDFDEACADGRIQIIGKDIDSAYIKAVVNESEGSERNIKIVYSPLHGAGQTNVLPVLRAVGFNDIVLVEEQMSPDGSFPTIENGKPNPEEKSANDHTVKLLMSEHADIAITNDPDADRIGVVVMQHGAPIYLSGNQSATLATDYALRKKSENHSLTSTHYIAKTIVTTDMLNALAGHYGVTCYGNMLVGFKYIGELIKSKEETDELFVIGGEESYGLLKGDYARDKDGAVGALMLAEYAAELKAQGSTLYDRLLELYAQHGLYAERLDTVVCAGADGFKRMQRIMTWIRKDMPATLGEYEVSHVVDYAALTRTEISTGKIEPVDCTAGDVVALEFGDSRRRITVRPSGTEPKIKFYVQWYEDANDDTVAQFENIQNMIHNLSRALEELLLSNN